MFLPQLPGVDFLLTVLGFPCYLINRGVYSGCNAWETFICIQNVSFLEVSGSDIYDLFTGKVQGFSSLSEPCAPAAQDLKQHCVSCCGWQTHLWHCVTFSSNC